MTLETASKKASVLTFNQLKQYLNRCEAEIACYDQRLKLRRVLRPLVQYREEFVKQLQLRFGYTNRK